MNIGKAINQASQILKRNEIKSFELDAEILMSQVIKKDRKYIILNPNMKLSDKDLKDYEYLVDKRKSKKPIAYLIGSKNFWKHKFNVTQDVLIPRPDTELIVEQVLNLSKYKSRLKILDVGIGSGCILLSILSEKKDFYGTGIDISQKCLRVCKENSLKLNLENRLKLIKSDIDNFNYGKYDIIISNPPYIKKLDLKYLEEGVINFEPKHALDGGIDGISEIRKTILKSSELIKKSGKLILEIAYDQKDKVKQILTKNGFYINKVLKDLAKNDRCIISTKI